jgi:hypothetical protein
VNLALQLGAPTSVEVLRKVEQSQWTFPGRAVIKYDFPARGGLGPVSVYWHDSARPGDPEAFPVPGMEKETILPPSNNLDDKGRPGPGRRGGRGAGGGGPRRAQGGPPQGAGGPGVPVFNFERRRFEAQPGILAGNGAVFLGTKGVMATVERGEGVHLLPAERWAGYELPPQVLTRSPGHMADWVRACKGGEASCSDFSIAAPYTEWVVLGVIALRVPGKLLWDSKSLRFTNSEEANQYVKPLFREGWELKL